MLDLHTTHCHRSRIRPWSTGVEIPVQYRYMVDRRRNTGTVQVHGRPASKYRYRSVFVTTYTDTFFAGTGTDRKSPTGTTLVNSDAVGLHKGKYDLHTNKYLTRSN